MLHSYFNPRSRVGNDRSGLNMVQPLLLFQSAVPRGERRSTVPVLPGTTADFNPRSRVGNDSLGGRNVESLCNFNPRSRVGNDNGSITNTEKENVFQSTFPRGERRRCGGLSSDQLLISIHVPAWGTTAYIKLKSVFTGISIHVPAWGTTYTRTAPDPE